MAGGFLRAGDTVSGQEARAVANINGNIENLFMIKSYEATAEKQKSEVRTIGKRGVQHKANGWIGKIKMEMYYCSSLFRKLMMEYIKTGRDAYFDITIINEDPTSTVGAQTMQFYSVNLDSVPMALINTEDTELSETVEATYDDIDMLTEFVKPSNLR